MKKFKFSTYKNNDFTQRKTYVEADVPEGLLDCASNINYAKYNYSEKMAMIKQLRKAVDTYLVNELRPRLPNERTKNERYVAEHIPNELLDVFNDYKYPNIGAIKMIAYKTALMSWIQTNLETL